MDAARVYPNTVPVLAANGLGGAVAGNDPDQVPLEPGLINDARRRFAPDGRAVDATGVMRLHVRNALGYAFLRPHHRDKLQKLLINSKWQKIDIAKAESAFYRRNYRDFVPQDLMMDFILNDNPYVELCGTSCNVRGNKLLQEDSSKVSKWQGNAISGVDCGQDGHVVFYPTGHVLQQACAWYSKGESEDATPCSSTVIETGARIRQFEVMGSRDAYRSASAAKIYAAARGTTNCTIVAAPSRVTPQNVRKMQAKAKISFPGMINHIAGSPHAEAELAIVMNGVVHCWDPEGGARNVNKDFMNMADRVLRCEYSSSHPCVLWTANRVKVSTLDLRQPPEHQSTLFDLTGAGAYITIYDVKRRARNPFQFVVGTGVSVELLDSRMAKQPLISWIQPQSYSRESKSDILFRAIDEVDLSPNPNDERGYIVSSSKRPKVTTLFPFERNRKRKRGKVMSLTSLRSNGDDVYSVAPRTTTEQLVASDAILDLHMEDGGEYTQLAGMCALRDEDSASASIYQLNTAGDLYSHRVSIGRPHTYRAAIQPELPCGTAARDDSTNNSLARTLPISVDAILPEHDTESLQFFSTLPVKVLRQQFPRLPGDEELPVKGEDRDEVGAKTVATTSHRENGADTKDSIRSGNLDESDDVEDVKAEAGSARHTGDGADAVIPTKTRSRSFDEDEVAEELLRICEPSASLFQLHRYALDKLYIEISWSELLQLLRGSSKFRLRTVQQAFPADTLRVLNPSTPGADDVHYRKGDPRIATCKCRPGSLRSQSPCESWSCIMPHAIIVSPASPELHLDDTAPSSTPLQAISDELADIIVAARAVYDGVYESGSESE